MKVEEILALLPEEKRDAAKRALDEHGAINAEKFADFIGRDEGRKLLQPVIDSAVSKAVVSHDKKFMEEKFPGILEAEIQKRNPAETPEQKRIAALEAENRKIREENTRKDQVAKAQKMLDELGLPTGLASRYAGMTDEETLSNIEDLKPLIDWREKAVKAKDEEWLSKGVKPGGGDGNPNAKYITEDQFNAMAAKERAAYMAEGGLIK